MILDNDKIQKWIESSPKKFELNVDKNNQPTWSDYVEQYRLIIYHLSENKNGINDISYPFLFLTRHFFELLLKKHLVDNGIELKKEHDFGSIFQQYEDNNLNIPSEVKEAIESVYNLDDDGAKYRYFNNIDFDREPIELGELFCKFKKIDCTNPFYRELTSINSCDKKVKGRFNCYMCEINGSGQLRTQYDTAIQRILSLITDGVVDILDIYLPLMFLLRHSLELALKTSLVKILSLEKDKEVWLKNNLEISEQHSIMKLFNMLYNYLSEEIVETINDDKFKTEFKESKNKLTEYQKVIHDLDHKSTQFRYVPDENMRVIINSKKLKEILKLYLETDSFLTFAVDVLKEDGIIPYTDDELAERMGFNL